MHKIDKKQLINILFIIAVLPFLIPRGVLELQSLSFRQVLYYMRIVFIIVGIVYCIIYRIKVSLITYIFTIFYVIELILCIIRGCSTVQAIDDLIYVLGIAILMEIALKNDLGMFIKSIAIILSSIIILNLLTLYIYPNGMYVDSRGWTANWLLGYYNSHIFVYLPWLLCILLWIYSKQNKFSILSLGSIGIALFGVYWAGSKTSMVSLVVILIISILFIKIIKVRLPNIFYFYIFVVVISYMIIFLNIQAQYSDIIQKYLNRDATFTGRTIIWNIALNYFRRHPIWGNGYVYYNLMTWISTQSHNAFLNIMVQQGIFGLIYFTIIIICISKRLNKFRNHPYAKIITLILIAYFIDFITEMYQLPHLLFLVIFLAYHIKDLVNSMPIESKTGKIKFKLSDKRMRIG